MKISSIVTTCRRNGVSYLEDTLRSLRAAGFEPQVMLDHELKGCYRNFKDALWFASQGDPDAVVVFQDDIEVSLGLREWLESNLWPEPPEDIGVVSLYTSGVHDQPVDGWHELDLVVQEEGHLPWGKAYGALANLFPIESARKLLRDNPRPELLNGNERIVAEWCANQGLSFWMHSPSMTKHTGEVSTFVDRYPTNVPLLPCITDARQCKRFCKDVAELQ